jgi:hypothetical protein
MSINATPLTAMAPSKDVKSAEEEEEEVQVPPPGWGEDDQISFSKETGQYLKQNDDGSEMEWNHKLKLWLPVVRSP